MFPVIFSNSTRETSWLEKSTTVIDALGDLYNQPNYPKAWKNKNPIYLLPGGNKAMGWVNDYRGYKELGTETAPAVTLTTFRHTPIATSFLYFHEICEGKSTTPSHLKAGTEDLDGWDIAGRGGYILLEGVGVRYSLKYRPSGTPATIGRVPQRASVVRTDPGGRWVIIEQNGERFIQFDVRHASPLARPPLGPPRGTPETLAAVGPDGNVIVLEGMHRLGAAQGGAIIPPANGGIPGLPGWLQYRLRGQ